ncbi:lachesin-like [Planococcus citri]|uniref:lachesin-like n=1 Tax=Planococcus citri TaxID=170843 RepID=UPI0031F73457
MTTSTTVVVVTLCIAHFINDASSDKKINRPVNQNLIIVPPDDNLPKFVTPVQNTTVTVGHNALLACIVDNLQTYKVTWAKVKTEMVLTMHQSVIAKDSRISLSYNDHRSWYLHIREVKEDDRGWYMCQINTEPVISQSVYLQVLVPPKIIEDETSSDMVVRELNDVVLQCKATGYPEPYVMWRRGDGNDFNYNGEKVNVVDGEKLHFNKISRLHMGTYYCIAQNGIPPPFNKKISLTVHFPPILHVPNQLVGATLSQKVTLLCISEAYPKSINYWTRGTGEMIIPGERYEIAYKHDMYTTNMMMTIHKVQPEDYGTYTCVSINPLGNTDGVIKLYEVTKPLETDWKLSLSSSDNITKITEDLSNQIISLNSTSRASKCGLDTIAASLLCIIGKLYKLSRRYFKN